MNDKDCNGKMIRRLTWGQTSRYQILDSNIHDINSSYLVPSRFHGDVTLSEECTMAGKLGLLYVIYST